MSSDARMIGTNGEPEAVQAVVRGQASRQLMTEVILPAPRLFTVYPDFDEIPVPQATEALIIKAFCPAEAQKA